MILRGLWRLAKGERAGITEFGASLDHFYASLAPLIGIPLAGALVMAVQGDWRSALLGFLSRLVAVLLLPVAVYEFARLFRREDLWMRTATALNWSFLMLFPVFAVAVLVGAMLVQAGLALQLGEMVTIGLMGLYLLWYRLFALSAGLGVNYWRAGVVLLVSSLAVGIATLAPAALGFGPPLSLPQSLPQS